MKHLHGWYSEKQRALLKHITGRGSISYRDALGKEVNVTQVAETLETRAMFDDLRYVGEVVEYIGPGLPAGWLRETH